MLSPTTVKYICRNAMQSVTVAAQSTNPRTPTQVQSTKNKVVGAFAALETVGYPHTMPK